ncbi:MAG: TIGR00341 family protein [Alloprevotella sp.]|nr:TIGR00341 family protein [Alloprevotella sp.]
MAETPQTLWKTIKRYFNALPDKEHEAETIEQISSGVSFHGSNLWVLVFAIFIASLGLNVNSTAVIIGAMLISPLMGPIIGMGLAIGIGDLPLLKSSIKNYFVATVISVLTAMIYFLISPLTEAQSELLARTSPTLYDVLIALCGGAAGILALSTRGKGNVLPGVAIATALMPPLCTAGYGLAMGEWSFFFGAFYLYFINTVFIALSTYIGVRMLRFRPKVAVSKERIKVVNRTIIGIVFVTMIPATIMTVRIIRESMLDNNIARFLKHELHYPGTQIVSHQKDGEKKLLSVVAVGNPISASNIEEAQNKLEQYSLGNYKLQVFQGAQSDSLLLLNASKLGITAEVNNQKLIEQSGRIQHLEAQLQSYTQYETMSRSISGEIKTLWPNIQSISLSQAVEVPTDSVISPDTPTISAPNDGQKPHIVLAVVTHKGLFSEAERTRLQDWLKARTKAQQLQLILRAQ